MGRKMKSVKQLGTALILSVVLVGCGCLPDAPDVRLRQINQRLNSCDIYKVKFGSKLIFDFEQEVPLPQCLVDGDFVITDDEIIAIKNAYKEARDCYIKTRQGRCD